MKHHASRIWGGPTTHLSSNTLHNSTQWTRRRKLLSSKHHGNKRAMKLSKLLSSKHCGNKRARKLTDRGRMRSITQASPSSNKKKRTKEGLGRHDDNNSSNELLILDGHCIFYLKTAYPPNLVRQGLRFSSNKLKRVCNPQATLRKTHTHTHTHPRI